MALEKATTGYGGLDRAKQFPSVGAAAMVKEGEEENFNPAEFTGGGRRVVLNFFLSFLSFFSSLISFLISFDIISFIISLSPPKALAQIPFLLPDGVTQVHERRMLLIFPV